jgi:proteasome accessory factor C
VAESAVDRTSRALDLIPFIHQNPGFTILELAEKFATTPGQIFKDLEMLFMCGLPGYSHLELIDLELDENYVAVNNPQNLGKPRKLSLPEVAALTLGLQAISPLISDPLMSMKCKKLQERLSAAVSSQHQAQLLNFSVQGDIAITLHDALISSAAAEQRGLLITYRSAKDEQLTERTIFPTQVYSAHGFFYVIAFCTLTHQVRHFRHDRIASAVLSHDRLNLSSELDADSREASFHIRVRLSKRNLYFIEEHREIVAAVTPSEDWVEVLFELGDRDWLLRALTALPGALEILEPADFRAAYEARLDAILDLYR